MKKYAVMNASVEMTRKRYLKEGGYKEYIAATNDTEQKLLALFDTMEEAKEFLKGKKSSIWPYPSNGLVNIEEYYIDEYQYDEAKFEIDENHDIFDFADLMGCDYVAPLDENSRKFVKDIYADAEHEEWEATTMRSMEQIVDTFIGNSADEDLYMGNFGDEANYIKWLINHELEDNYNEDDLDDLYDKYLQGYRLEEYKNEMGITTAYKIYDGWKDDSIYTTESKAAIISSYGAYAEGALDIVIDDANLEKIANIIKDWSDWLNENNWTGNDAYYRLEKPLTEIELCKTRKKKPQKKSKKGISR